MKNGKIDINKIIFYVLMIGIYGTLTNKFYISPFPTLIAILFVPFLFLIKNKIHKVTFALLPYFFITIISVLIYLPSSFIEFGFYRYDGNVFISFFPLLLIPFFRLDFNIVRIVYRFLVFAIVLNTILFFVGFTSFGQELEFMAYKGLGRNFHGLFKAHNAAGGFFSFLASIAFIFFYYNKTAKNFLMLLLSLVFLFDTGSRGSLLGLIIGLTCYFLYKWKGKGLIWALFSGVTILLIVIISHTYGTFEKQIFSNQLEVQSYIRETEGWVGSKKMNIYQRTYGFWPRCVYAFKNSPVFGIGFGGINDLPLKFESGNSFIRMNNQEKKVFDDQHGHNSYLHILSEQGIIGLAFFLFFWIYIYKFIIKNDKVDVIRDILLVVFFNISIMSFTEHRITTPSNALPFILFLSLYILYLNGTKQIEIQ